MHNMLRCLEGIEVLKSPLEETCQQMVRDLTLGISDLTFAQRYAMLFQGNFVCISY